MPNAKDIPEKVKVPHLPRRRTPTVLQMEAVECGAAALGSILGHYGRFVPLEQLRMECGVSRDGSKASNVLKAARKFGLVAKGFQKEIEALGALPTPMIVFWNFNHFVVLEGHERGKVFINDPASGPRVVSPEEFDRAFTGVVLTFEPGPEFVPGGEPSRFLPALAARLRGSSAAVTFAILAGLALVVPGLVLPVFTRIFVDDILLASKNDWLRPLLVAMGLTALVRGLLTDLQQMCLLRLQTKLALVNASRFLWHVLRLPMSFFHQRWPGEVAARVQSNDKVAALLSGELAANAIGVVSIVFYAVIMLFYDVALTLLGIAFASVNVIVLRYVSRRRVDESQKLMAARGQVLGTSMGGLQMMEDIKGTGAEDDFFGEWSGRHARSVAAEQKLGALGQYLAAMPELLSGVNTVAILAVGGLRVMDGHMSVGMLMAFQSLMASMMGPVNRLVTLSGQMQELQADVTRLDDVLHHDLDPETTGEGREEGGRVIKLTGRLEFRGVTFGYSRLDKPLIEDFNLSLEPGERVAIVGASGSGKSTLAKLASGLYRPWSGQVLFDGKPRDELPRAVLNNSVGLVDQDIFVFGGTVRDNLTVWDPTMPEVDIVRAGKDASIHDDLLLRPGGYDSIVDEAGRNFSGGQRQRLEIARALVVNPTILVLDEATSALDTGTEKAIDDQLRKRGCTCLIVAHRLSTIRDCDEIIVLERGKVVQRGTHESLKSIPGPYAQLIES